MKKIFLLTLLFAGLLTSCKKDKHESKAGIFNGQQVQVGNGKAWSWIQLDEESKPLTMGVTITQAALNSLPQGGNGMHGVSYLLKLPSQKSVTIFDHVSLDWNPHGHEPEHIYGKPHFDFHFYTMSEADRLAIPPYEQAKNKFDNVPGAAYLPANYMNPGGGVPQMGAHWLDLTSPELNPNNPAGFTQTFIYGTYDGKVTFLEPMITKEFIDATTAFTRDIPQPQKVQKTGYYPTKMHIRKHHGDVEVLLDGFVYRTQS